MVSSNLQSSWIFLHLLKILYLQSAKTNLNVEEVFFSIARDIKQRLADTDSRAEVYDSLLLVKSHILLPFPESYICNGFVRIFKLLASTCIIQCLFCSLLALRPLI